MVVFVAVGVFGTDDAYFCGRRWHGCLCEGRGRRAVSPPFHSFRRCYSSVNKFQHTQQFCSCFSFSVIQFLGPSYQGSEILLAKIG